MNLRLGLLGVVVATALFTAACGEDGTVDVNPGTAFDQSSSSVTGRTFRGLTIEVDGEARAVPQAESFEIVFDRSPGQISASASCNSMGGTYSIDGDVLTTSDVFSTEMGCDPEREAFDGLLGALITSPTFVLDGDQLTLTVEGEKGSLRSLLTDASTDGSTAPAAMEGTSWVLESFIDGETASSVPADVGSVTMTLADGRLRIDTGCNGVGAGYTLSGDVLTTTPGVSTKMFCGDAINQVESKLSTVIGGDLTVTLDRQSLTLTNANGAGLAFRTGD